MWTLEPIGTDIISYQPYTIYLIYYIYSSHTSPKLDLYPNTWTRLVWKFGKWSNTIARWICSKVWHPTNNGLQFKPILPNFRFSVNSYPIINTIQLAKHVQFLTYHDLQHIPISQPPTSMQPWPKWTTNAPVEYSIHKMGCVFSFGSQPCVIQHCTTINILFLLTLTLFFYHFFFQLELHITFPSSYYIDLHLDSTYQLTSNAFIYPIQLNLYLWTKLLFILN